MFKKFLVRIYNAQYQEDALDQVFYAPDGIDIAFQKGQISWKDHELLLGIIEVMQSRGSDRVFCAIDRDAIQGR